MTRRIVTLQSPSDVARAKDYIDRAAAAGGYEVEFRRTDKRTGEQNKRMHAMLRDIATQCDWHGLKLHKDDWKVLFLEALSAETRAVPNMDGTGFVTLGRSSSRLKKGEMSDLIEMMFKFGAERGVVWSDPQEKAA